MSFASTSAFVLSEPYGPLVSGALSVVSMFFGESSGTDDALRQGLTDALADFRNQQFAANIKSATDSIKTAADWLDKHISTVQDINDMNLASAFVKDVLGDISGVDSPNALLPNALVTLNDPQYLNDPVLGPSAYSALAFGVGLYLTYLRLRVQMQSWQAVNMDNTDLNYGWFDIYRQNANQWCGLIATQIDGYQDSRLEQVGAVQMNGNSFNFQDTGARPAGAGIAPVPGWAGSDSASQSQSQADRDKYIGYLQDALTIQYPDTAAIEKWEDNLESWENSLKPLKPQQAPLLTNPAAWGGPTPQGSNWVNGASVQYALTYKNAGGESPLSDWSPPIPITSQAFPTVNIPVDAMDLASSRHIHRMFGGGGDTVVGIVSDNSTLTWQDTSQ